MYDYKDPARLTRIATGFLLVYLLTSGAQGLLALAALLAATSEDAVLGPALPAVLALLFFVAFFGCTIVVGMWIYRTNANAHSFSSEMTITPGWAVGWFFIPLANLVKPYQGVKETWLASHFDGDAGDTPLVGIWWGLWLVSNVLARLSTQFSDALTPTWFDVAAGAVDVALSVVLIRLMHRLAAAQARAVAWEVFA
jgi:hypothetical protein